jgi:hypothetical protein
VTPGELLSLLQLAGVSDVVQIQCLEEISEEAAVPDEIHHVLLEFESVFQEPTELPPARQFDHTIPLMEGAKPVNLLPYRYSPE